MTNRNLLRIFALATFVLLIQLAASAQVASGTIVGTIRDSSGAIVPGVTVTSRNVETGVTRMVIAGELGNYTIPALPVGTYDLEASISGFRTEVRKGVTVTVGASEIGR